MARTKITVYVTPDIADLRIDCPEHREVNAA
jgi:hypothetical protein